MQQQKLLLLTFNGLLKNVHQTSIIRRSNAPSETPRVFFLLKKLLFFLRKSLDDGTWTFEFGIENGKNISFWVVVRFMANDKINVQTRGNTAFDWLPVSSAVCKLGRDRYPGNYLNFDYHRSNFHES